MPHIKRAVERRYEVWCSVAPLPRSLDPARANRRWVGTAPAHDAQDRTGVEPMEFKIQSLSIQLIEALRPLVPTIKRHDRALADQLTRAATSVALNIAESNYSDPGTRKSRLFTAAGSANEVRAGLRVAVAWGYCTLAQAEGARLLLERIVPMLWKLTH
jgi:four helix bundle protein